MQPQTEDGRPVRHRSLEFFEVITYKANVLGGRLRGAMSEGFIDTARQGFRASAREFLPQFSEFACLLGHHFKLSFCIGKPNRR